jgi:hypothetical protein
LLMFVAASGVNLRMGSRSMPIERNLQRAHLELLGEKLNGRTPVTDDSRAIIRGELRALSASITQVLPRVTDRPTKLHH